MDILVLVKPVPEPETRLRPNANGTMLDAEGIKWVLAGYDESAVEQALLLKEAVPGSTVRALSFGALARAEEVLRASLALGCDSATLVEQAADAPVDPAAAARALAVAVKRHRFDLLLAGKQAGDDEAGLVLPMIAEILGVPDFTPVVDVRWNDADRCFDFQVVVDGGSDKIRAAPPLALGLQQAWNDPRTARLPNILKSRRMTLDKVPWADVAGAVEAAGRSTPTAFRLPPPRMGARIIEYKEPAEAAHKLIQILSEEAKVFP